MRGKTLGFIGTGHMGGAMLRGVLSAGLVGPDRIIASDREGDVLRSLGDELGIVTTADNRDVAARANVLILGVKPRGVRGLLQEIQGHLHEDPLVVSLAAGVPLATMEAILPKGTPLIRTMPNTPCLVGVGASAYALGENASRDHARVAELLLGAVGKAWEVPERHMDAITALSGSGPAYLFFLLEGMISGAVAAGLDEKLARDLALQTVVGAAALAGASPESPSVLRERVTSPGGTTERAIATLRERGVHEALVAAVVAARDRGAELGRALSRTGGEPTS